MFMNLLARLFPSARTDETEGSRSSEGGSSDHKMAPEKLADPMDALAIELGRARRYEHDLAIVVVRPCPMDGDAPGKPSEDGAEPSANGHAWGRLDGAPRGDREKAEAEAAALARRLGLPPEEALACLTAAGLREVLRTSDVVCYDGTGDQFVLGLMEADGPTARRAVSRVRALFRDRLHVDLQAGIAQFPADGLTLEDLVETARAKSEGSAPEPPDERPGPHAEGRYRIRPDGATRRARRRAAEPTPADSRMAGGE